MFGLGTQDKGTWLGLCSPLCLRWAQGWASQKDPNRASKTNAARLSESRVGGHCGHTAIIPRTSPRQANISPHTHPTPVSAALERRKQQLDSLFLTRKTKAARRYWLWSLENQGRAHWPHRSGPGEGQEVRQRSPDDSVRAGRG